MDEGHQDFLRFWLMDEIGRIQSNVSAIGVPRDMGQRSLIARYGKLLLVSQRLLNVLPKLKDKDKDKEGKVRDDLRTRRSELRPEEVAETPKPIRRRSY